MHSGSLRSSAQGKRLRSAAGQWLKSLREAKGLTQRELADRVGLRYYTFVSQIEGGYGRIPPEQYEAWADALGIEHREFASELVQYYDPCLHKMLFGHGPEGPAAGDEIVAVAQQE
jgi:transcriptional regulator with XRE-family HTH domain